MNIKRISMVFGTGAVLTVLFSSVIAENIEIDFGTTERPETTEMFIANISGPISAVSGEVSGSAAEQIDEIEKCVFYSSFYDEPTTAIRKLHNAQSNLTATVIITEDRTNDLLGRHWILALQRLEEKYNPGFEDLHSMDYFFPYVTNVTIELAGKVDDPYTGDPAIQSFLLAQLNVVLEGFYEMGKNSHRETGILRATTRDQAAVCAMLLYRELQVTMTVTGRLPDRVVDDEYLDRDCVEKMVEYATKEVSKRFPFLKRTEHGDVDMRFVLGTIVKETPADDTNWFGGPLDEGDIPCAVRLREDQKLLQALVQWRRILDEWTEILQQDPDGDLGSNQISALSRHSHLKLREPTWVTYSYNTYFTYR